MVINGRCHCGNIRFRLDWPGDASDLRIRNCGCTFCVKHGGSWTSHRDAELVVQVGEEALLSKYRFGTATADFYVCARCGVPPLVVSEIDGALYAVVNANTFEGIDIARLPRAPVSFDGEETGDRLARRRRGWISRVRIGKGS